MTNPEAPPLLIVAVHGVGNSFGADTTGTRLDQLRAPNAAARARHLGNGLGVAVDRIDLDFAYYADKLLTAPVAEAGQDGVFLDNPLAQEVVAAWAQELAVPDEVSQGHATVPLRALS